MSCLPNNGEERAESGVDSSLSKAKDEAESAEDELKETNQYCYYGCVKRTHNDDFGDKLGEDSDSDLDTTLSQEEDVDIDTDKSVELSNSTGQDDLQLIDDRSDMFNGAVFLGDIV